MGIKINGKSFFGSNISISGNKIIIDGQNVTPNEKSINIEVIGNIEKLEVDCCDKINISGNIGTLKNGSGDVECQNIESYVTSGSGNVVAKGYIKGNVQTGSGDVTTNSHIEGNVNTSSGDVSCEGNILGSVKTGSGDIKYSKSTSTLKD